MDAQALLALLRSEEEAMSDLLLRLVRAESPSLEPEAQREAFGLVAAELEALGFRVRRLRGRKGGDHLYARRPGARLPAQLVVGHLDTVWPTGTLARMPARSEGGVVAGPGALDAKSGLVQLVFALRALRALALPEPVSPLVLVVADEEIGSRESRAHLCRLAALSCRALVLEPAFGPGGALKTARKGVGGFSIRISGRAAHAGLEPERGASAILELSRVVQRLFALNDPAHGISVNVGTIDGGLRSNVVAPEASATVDVRVPTRAAVGAVERAIRALRPSAPGLSLRVEGGFGRPPLERTERNCELWALAERAAEQLGLPLEQAAVGGGSDGNLTSLHTATLDGLGGVGEGAHAEHEHVVAARLPERAALLALLLASSVAPPVASHALSVAAAR